MFLSGDHVFICATAARPSKARRDTIGNGIFQNGSQRRDIAAGINKFLPHWRDEIARSSYMVASRHGTSAAHRFVHNYGKWLVFRRKHH